MLTRRSLTLGAARAAFAAKASAGDASATAFLTAIYNSYKGKNSKGTSLDSERAIRRYFEPKLATLMAKDQRTAARRHDVGSLEFDPFIDAQDWEIATFDIAISDTAPAKAQATVKFINLGEHTTITLDLVQVNKAWRIYDITWLHDGKTDTLRKIFVR
jgi:hypothetical protein